MMGDQQSFKIHGEIKKVTEFTKAGYDPESKAIIMCFTADDGNQYCLELSEHATKQALTALQTSLGHRAGIHQSHQSASRMEVVLATTVAGWKAGIEATTSAIGLSLRDTDGVEHPFLISGKDAPKLRASLHKAEKLLAKESRDAPRH